VLFPDILPVSEGEAVQPLSAMNPMFYMASVGLHRLNRRCRLALDGRKYSCLKTDIILPFTVFSHRSLLLRKLAGTSMNLQLNKVKNLRIAVSFVDGVVVNPGETFSFWKLVGKPSKRRGFQRGLQLSFGKLVPMTGGGLCQLSNLLHWMVLHTELQVAERHRHSSDPFPDYRRHVPFGTGATVFYNYLDFSFINNSTGSYQIKVWIEEEFLCGEIRCSVDKNISYSIAERNHRFVRRNTAVYRENEIWKLRQNTATASVEWEKCLFKNSAWVLYDTETVPVEVETE